MDVVSPDRGHEVDAAISRHRQRIHDSPECLKAWLAKDQKSEGRFRYHQTKVDRFLEYDFAISEPPRAVRATGL